MSIVDHITSFGIGIGIFGVAAGGADAASAVACLSSGVLVLGGIGGGAVAAEVTGRDDLAVSKLKPLSALFGAAAGLAGSAVLNYGVPVISALLMSGPK